MRTVKVETLPTFSLSFFVMRMTSGRNFKGYSKPLGYNTQLPD